jgi:hypothetical protein
LGMPDYRLYFLDRSGHIGGVVELTCDDDGAAGDEARAHADGRAMELWNRERQVRRFPAGDDRLEGRLGGVDAGPQGLDPQA